MMNTDHWITAVLALRKAREIVVFTGAGISAESGIPTFRDTDGFWQRFPPEEFATWGGLFQKAVTDPRKVAEFILHVVEPIARAQPNLGHQAIAQLQQHAPTTVVTQNIDGLHQSAGSERVLEIHGSLLEIVDISTRTIVRRFERAELIRIAETLQKYVDKKVSLISFLAELAKEYPFDWRVRHRPNLILFGDQLAEPAWSEANVAVERCDLLVSVGTSGVVYPAAQLPSCAAAAGATVISIAPHSAEGCWLQGKAGELLPRLIKDAFETPAG